MRHSRLKPDYQDSWHHCYNRAAGTAADRPFDDADKEKFVQLLHRVADFYCVQIAAYQVMSNHWHILLRAPMTPPSEEETIRRFAAFHGGKRTLLPGSKLCADWRGRLRDVSWCMRHLQHLYTAWYNRTRPIRRRGPLWAGRFKNTVLESGAAVWACWTYLERNPVRAGMVADPADYRFCSYGAWCQSGRHPFPDTLLDVLRPSLPVRFYELAATALQAELHREFARLAAEEERQPPAEVEKAMAAAVASPAFTLSARRRVRHWVDGLAIGSELFVRNTLRHAIRSGSAAPIRCHRLAHSEPAPDGLALCCWRRLRVMRN